MSSNNTTSTTPLKSESMQSLLPRTQKDITSSLSKPAQAADPQPDLSKSTTFSKQASAKGWGSRTASGASLGM
ncbi:hypothetical protein DL96DRAFT_1712628 [Flagelloscypha sp. PMI_526]|nr:hypothetical protein DL96DRAFT_1712628 [Flagelloscypha sp. PMI_526]